MTILYLLDDDGVLRGQVNTALLPGASVAGAHTDIPPPEGCNRFVDGQWTAVADHRGSAFYDPNSGDELVIQTLGDEPPVGWLPGPRPTEPLDAAKAAAWRRVKAERDAQEFGLFAYGDHLYDGDPESQRRLNLAVLGAMNALQAQQPWSIDWTLANNQVVTLSALDLIGVVQAMGEQINQAHQLARQRRAAIESAATAEELDTIFAPAV